MNSTPSANLNERPVKSTRRAVTLLVPNHGFCSKKGEVRWFTVVTRMTLCAFLDRIDHESVTRSRPRRHFRQHRFEHRRHPPELPGANHQVPQRLELLPAGGVREVFELVLERAVRERR